MRCQEAHAGSFSTSASSKNSVCRYKILVCTPCSNVLRGPQPFWGVRKSMSESMVMGPDAVWAWSAVEPCR